MNLALVEQLTKLLEGLGRNKVEIAANLKKAGIKGRPKSCSTCPIAKYLQKETGHQDTSVSAYTRVYSDDEVMLAVVKTPEACRDFIGYFDDGGFTDLNCDS